MPCYFIIPYYTTYILQPPSSLSINSLLIMSVNCHHTYLKISTNIHVVQPTHKLIHTHIHIYITTQYHTRHIFICLSSSTSHYSFKQRPFYICCHVCLLLSSSGLPFICSHHHCVVMFHLRSV